MKAETLATILKVSRRYVFALKRRYPTEAPKSFDDIEGWRAFLSAHQLVHNPHKVAEMAGAAINSDANGNGAVASNMRYIEARARRMTITAELALLRLEATRRTVIPKADVRILFARIGSVLRARILRMRNDLPCELTGLSEAGIQKVLDEKIAQVLSELVIPDDFWQPQSVVT
jgi:hypothetical protein